jgi:hypothetical protein
LQDLALLYAPLKGNVHRQATPVSQPSGGMAVAVSVISYTLGVDLSRNLGQMHGPSVVFVP